MNALLRRDLQLALRQGVDWLVVIAFFAMGAVLFAFGAGAERLAEIAAGVIWVMALLSVLLSLERLFQSDYEDGSLEVILLSPAPLVSLVLAKLAAHWLTTALPLILATPIIALLLQLEATRLVPLMVAMIAGTPALTVIGALGAALTLGARRASVITAVLVLPLFVPVLIFGVGAADKDGTPALMILGALTLSSVALGPAAIAAALRQAAT